MTRSVVTTVVAHVPDLMDRSRLSGAVGERVRFCARVGEVVTVTESVVRERRGVGDVDGLSRPDGTVAPEVAADAGGAEVVVVVVDLSREGALDALAALADRQLPGVRTVGFGAHVERELLATARAAGCDRVLARSTFFGNLPAHLR